VTSSSSTSTQSTSAHSLSSSFLLSSACCRVFSLSAMIILDDADDQHPKIASPLPLHVRTTRPTTPTPSLPDYETSQEQLKYDLKKRRPLSKRLKWALWGLAMYFVVTIAIGVPLIVIVSSIQDSCRCLPQPSSENSGLGQPI
jgi:hypothetical protein